MRNAPVKTSYLKSQQSEISEQEKDNRNVSATYPDKPFSPFYLPDQL